ncbi:response regulator [Phycisphaerales bacterium AB-hyl4]|uniref:Response regulator n=1 Tax=Natronomicrosphaera hydrolytica TaxID=3242702 RepID=A0ABV4U093_9BACT
MAALFAPKDDGSPEQTVRVLIVAEPGSDARWLEPMLANAEAGMFVAEHVDSLDEELIAHARDRFDAVLIDLPSGDHASLEETLRLTRQGGFPPVIVINHTNVPLSGVHAVHGGVQDYLLRTSLSPDVLVRSISYAIERDRLRQHAIAESERFQAVINANADGMLVIDQEGVIQFANPMAEQLLNQPIAKLLGTHFGVPVVNGEATEIAIYRRDGSGGIAEMRVSQLRWAGEPAVLATLRDISVRKAIEAELRSYRQQMQALSAELSRVEQSERRRLAQLLHDDLQQWLVAVRIQLDMISKGTNGTTVAESAGRGLELLDQAIAVSRSLTVELSPTMLYELGLISAIQWLGRTMQQRHNLAVTLDAEELTQQPTEELRTFLFQSVRELLLNVVKHANVDEASVTITSDKNEIQIVVADRGQGMDVTRSQRRPDEGSFGLFNIRQRLEYWGGSFEVDSQPGNGTRTIIRAPLRAHAVASQADDAEASTNLADSPPRKAADASSRPLRLLLADDHPSVREGLAGLLAQYPTIQIVGEAGDGMEAVRLVRELRPDVVVMDVSMPGMDGIDAVRSICSEWPDARLIGLSMYDAPYVEQAMYAAGVDAYLPKGSPTDELISAIFGERLGHGHKSR